MTPFPFGVVPTIGLLLLSLLIVIFLVRRIVNKIRISTGSRWAIFIYLLVSIWPLYESIKLTI